MKALVSTLIFLFASVAQAGPVMVSDELVTNLSCQHLSPASIYRAIDRDKALGWERRIPLRNRTKNLIQQCWSLARFQRLALMLGRHDESVARFTPEHVAELARGYRYLRIPGARMTPKVPIHEFEVFSWPGMVANSPYDMPDVLSHINTGLKPYDLDFAISLKQASLFFRGSNLAYVFRSPNFQVQTASLKEIFRRTREKRLPLIDLRYSKTNQHVVLGLDVRQDTPNRWTMRVIDPNNPLEETTVEIERKADGYEIVHDQPWAATTPRDKVDAMFLFDDGEEQKIDLALVRHYGRKCQEASLPKSSRY